MPRKYSVDEIEQMRAAVDLMIPDYRTGADRTVAVEERLRTYMANETEPYELDAATTGKRIALESRLRAIARGE